MPNVIRLPLTLLGIALFLGCLAADICSAKKQASGQDAESSHELGPNINQTEISVLPKDAKAAALLRQYMYPLEGESLLPDVLLDRIGDARLVLLGEATHGTHEFYQTKSDIIKALISHKNFDIIAVEVSWNDAQFLNRFIQSDGGISVEKALAVFRHYPAWMWRNQEIRDLIIWLREYNAGLPEGRPQVAFYGLDLYEMKASLEVLGREQALFNPQLARFASDVKACFEPFGFGADLHAYGKQSHQDGGVSCEAVSARLLEVMAAKETKDPLSWRAFNLLLHALTVKNGEAYFRIIYDQNEDKSWNFRDRHMMTVLNALLQYHRQQGYSSKAVVWAHNSHVGDARATEMYNNGQLNIGQLVREHFEGQSFLIGFTTYSGVVAASDYWGDKVRFKKIVPANPESYSALFHLTGQPAFFLDCHEPPVVETLLLKERLHRVIGVVYLPQAELENHYYYARLSAQYDALFHFDHSQAIVPLSLSPTLGEDIEASQR